MRAKAMAGLLCMCLFAAVAVAGEVTGYTWSANTGWINWGTPTDSTAVITNKIAYGYIYSANIGWINLGDGTPANGNQYSNTSASDFGVNVTPALSLKGYAYSANAGWINFDVVAQAGASNQPRVDPVTGKLKGYAWGANIGWIALESPGLAAVTTGLRNEADFWALYE